ncbi:MAG TPA: PemK family transcriptional regulator [Elusimicrobia bacterium]|nr:PemK family transcriptional regulator [Elusimicrobiota bacterium]
MEKGVQPQRGQIYMLDFGEIKGRELAGEHPALVVQNDIGNKYAPVTIVIAVHSDYGKQELPVCVKVKSGIGGLRKDSIMDAGQILTIDKKRLGRLVGTLPYNVMMQVDEALKKSLQLK